MTWRIACVWIPDFAIHISTQTYEKDVLNSPIALVEKAPPSRVVAMNQMAADHGVCIGQTAIRASASNPTLHCVTWNQPLIQKASESLRKELLKCTPGVVSIQSHAGTYLLDARGMSHLGGEDTFSTRVQSIVRTLGYPNLRIGIASTVHTACAAALQSSVEHPITRVSVDEEDDFRCQLPLHHLSIAPELFNTLRGLGVTQVSQLTELSPSALESRFGDAGLSAWKAAQGEDHRRIHARPEPELCASTLCLDDPVELASSLIFGLRHMSMELAGTLREQYRSASALKLTLSLDDHSEHLETLHPARPVQDGASIFELVRDRLDHLSRPLSSPIVELSLVAHETVHADPEQVHMGHHRWDPKAVEKALDRLQGRFAQTVVFEARTRADTRPECAGYWQPVNQVPVQSVHAPIDHQGPSVIAPMRRQLESPVPVHVRTDEMGRPIELRWRGRWLNVDARGPERLSGGWWQPVPYAYEEYNVILPSQEILWLRHNAIHRLWTLNGWFD